MQLLASRDISSRHDDRGFARRKRSSIVYVFNTVLSPIVVAITVGVGDFVNVTLAPIVHVLVSGGVARGAPRSLGHVLRPARETNVGDILRQ